MSNNLRMRANTRQNWLTAAFVGVFIFAVSLYFVNDYTEHQTGWAQTILHLILLGTWTYSIRIRVIQRNIRVFLVIMCHLLILWAILRAVKYYIIPLGSVLLHWIWYLYYLPLLFYPVCAMMAAIYIGRPDNAPVGRKHIYSFGVSIALLMVVLTNDLHQFVFTFPDGIPSDKNYNYAFMYYVVTAWFVICVISLIYMMFRKSRLPGRSQRILVPVIPLIIGGIYDICYVTGHAEFYKDMVVVFYAVTIATFELAIRVGLIRSNTNYADLLTKSGTAARILDNELRIKYSSEKAHALDIQSLNKLIEQDTLVAGNSRYSCSPITGGYVVWQDDITELLITKAKVESANEFLEGNSSALNNRYKTSKKLKRLEEQNRLFSELQSQNSENLQKLSKLLSEFERTDDKALETDYLLMISDIAVYEKRRNNLILMAKENDGFPSMEFANCINDMAKNFDAFGIACSVVVTSSRILNLNELLTLIESVHFVTSATLLKRPSYFISLSVAECGVVLTLRISGIEDLTGFEGSKFEVEQEDDDEFLLRMIVGEGASI